MADNPNDEQEPLFSYELDPETETEELDRHRARFAGLSLEHFRIMRAYAAFKQQRLDVQQQDTGQDEDD